MVEGMARIGLVVHPSRDIEEPLRRTREWAWSHGSELVQVAVDGQRRVVADREEARDCDVILAIGGDGTTLAAIRAAAAGERPVLGIACGSLGVLATVPASEVGEALDRFAAGRWVGRALPALAVDRDGADRRLAFNDIAVVREGSGQVRAAAEADGVLFCRFAGDGCVVSTPAGSSAYTLAAGGPLLAPGVAGFVLTPLPIHGAACPPLVLSSSSELRLSALPGHTGARLEVDGQFVDSGVGELTVSYVDAAANIVAFTDQEPLLTGLRRRRVIVDSARIVAEDGYC
jgi:NAD+ kinase